MRTDIRYLAFITGVISYITNQYMIRLYHKKQGRQQLIEISCFLKNYGRAAEAYERNAYKK